MIQLHASLRRLPGGHAARRLRGIVGALALSAVAAAAGAAPAAPAGGDAVRGIEQTLATAQQDKRGLTLYVSGQAISGAVVRIEAGQWVELRSQQFGRIVVRLDRIDAVAAL